MTTTVASAAGPVCVLQLYTITLWYPREEGAISVLGLCCFVRLIHGRRTCCERFGGSTPRITVVCKPSGGGAVPWTRRIQALVEKGATRYEPWGLLPLRVECRASARVAGGEPRHVVLQARIVVLAQPRRPLADRCCRRPTCANEDERIGPMSRYGFPACDLCVGRRRAYWCSHDFYGDYTPPPWWTRRPSAVNHSISPGNDDLFIVHAMNLIIPTPTVIFEPMWRWDIHRPGYVPDENPRISMVQLGALKEMWTRKALEEFNLSMLATLPFFREQDE